ncbi:hypothetical protein QEN19_000222 [Hanseniaspora menglaensis]
MRNKKKPSYRIVRIVVKVVNAFVIILFIGFLLVAPLDILSRSLKKSQFVDFFIAVAGIVLIIILNVYWFLYRFFTVKQILKYIPKHYIPIFTATPTNDNINNDRTKHHSRKRALINFNLYNLVCDAFDLMPNLQSYYNYNKSKIVFNKGVSPPQKSYNNYEIYNNCEDIKSTNSVLPFLSNYDSIMQAFSQDLKFSLLNEHSSNFLTIEMGFLENKGYTFTDYIKNIWRQCKEYQINVDNFDFPKFCRFYSKLKYCGRTPNLNYINEKKFILFMQMTMDFYNIKIQLEKKMNINSLKESSMFSKNNLYFSNDQSADFGYDYNQSENSHDKLDLHRHDHTREPDFSYSSSNEGDRANTDKDINSENSKSAYLSRLASSSGNSTTSLQNVSLSNINIVPLKKKEMQQK